MKNNKNVLIISNIYPPSNESSGIQRILKFSQYLPTHGWDVQVLTMHPRAYGPNVDDKQLDEIPDNIVVTRAFALNTAIHLAFKGRYFGWMAIPDRWVSWVPFAVIAGLKMIRQQRPNILWSSYPFASAHLVALILNRITGIPWVADFRDPMLYRNDHVTGLRKKAYSWIEQQAIKHSSRVTFTTPGAIESYAKLRYPNVPDERWVLIPNGFDEGNFLDAENSSYFINALNSKKEGEYVLVHSGHLYRAERDPSYFFEALSLLFEQGKFNVGELKIILRATGHDDYYGSLIARYNLAEVVFLEKGISYQEALAEMLVADGLILFQSSMCNHQIPAKLYEYLRAKRPIFALTDPIGDTAGVLKEAKITAIAPLDDVLCIADEFSRFLDQLRTQTAVVADVDFVATHSRAARCQLLARLLNQMNDGFN